MGSLTFLTGGARSGKSTLALELARRSGRDVTFIATAPRPGDGSGVIDDEMAARIERHRRERSEQPSGERSDQPGQWVTIEEPLDLIGALRRAEETFTIVDCLTLWVSNLMWAGRTDEAIEQLAVDTAAAATAMTTPVVVVTNEVGMGIHPDNALGRRYRDALGRVNQAWAVLADDALLMVAGRAVRLDDPTRLLHHARVQDGNGVR